MNWNEVAKSLREDAKATKNYDSVATHAVHMILDRLATAIERGIANGGNAPQEK